MIYTATAGAVKVKVCSHLRWGRIFRKPRLHAYPAGADFCSCASSRATLHVGSPCLRIGQPSNAPPLLLSPPGLTTRRGPHSKTRLGRCPKTPVAGCAGYGLLSGSRRKAIRTAHRIAPKVAAGASALSPHPLSRWRERGSDGRASAGRQFGAWGMLGLAEGAGRGGWGAGLRLAER